MSKKEAELRELAARQCAIICALPYVAQILERLRRELSPGLKFHSLSHTEDVMREALLFALHDGLGERELLLLGIAAAYHDAGFLQSSKDNEPLGAALMRSALTTVKEFSADELGLMEKLILDTQLVFEGGTFTQKASTPLSGYLLDADLSNLGREDFLERTKLLMQEQRVDDEVGFLKQALKLLRRHTWHTSAARVLRDEQKQKNLAALEAMPGVNA